MPLMRVPYTAPLPSTQSVPRSATSLDGAVAALSRFLSAPATNPNTNGKTVVLSGAGISVASGLADYRGTKGTYTLNRTYRPIYFHEFANVRNHEARKRYWARSFLGWTNLHKAAPNAAHRAVGRLGESGHVSSVITQNVDSFHPQAHPKLPTMELHGYLRRNVCLSCRSEYSRDDFQSHLSKLNPSWADFLAEMLESGALTTENPDERRRRGLKTNPDGDVEVPGVEYGTFRYPPCPVCLVNPPAGQHVDVDADGAWAPTSTAGILKPAVIMFGESVRDPVRHAVEEAINEASRILILGSSLATYSAWRLVKRAKEQGMPIAVVNIGGVRDEQNFLGDVPDGDGSAGVRCDHHLEELLPLVVDQVQQSKSVMDSPTRQYDFQPAPWR